MKVTGWTYWENGKYIDIAHEGMKLRTDIMNSVPTKWPTFTFEMSDEDKLKVSEQMGQHLKEVDEAFEDNELLLEEEKLYTEIYDTVVADVRKNGYHFTGDEHQNCDYGCPVIDDKYILCLSMRSWGGLIVEAFPDEFDKGDKYDYVKWAWNGSDMQEVMTKLPDKSLWVK